LAEGIHQQQAQLGAATRCYQRSLHLSRDDGDRDGQARTLRRLAETRDRAGDRAAARAAWEQALEILDELRHPDATEVRSRLAGLGR
jgi:tetratricopeptide (TPR) repeat protein